MSRETLLDLNRRTRIGFTDKRGPAWHNDAALRDQHGLQDNHFPGAIPLQVVRDLFANLEVFEGVVHAQAHVLNDSGVETIDVIDDSRKAILARYKDEGVARLVNVTAEGYKVHDYTEWLLHTLDRIGHGGLQVSSAGLLQHGAKGWVQAEIDQEVLTTKSGVKFRPYVLATTSLDSSIATTYLNGAEVVVCDNTLSAALNAKDKSTFKIRHTRNSQARSLEIADNLGLVLEQTAETFTAQVDGLVEVAVTDKVWSDFLEAYAPTQSAGQPKTGRGLTNAQNAQDTLRKLWNHDVRVSPWKNTAFGVLQAVNTYVHHEQTVKGAERSERNLLRKITGEFDKVDNGTLSLLDKVLSHA